jgi:hypothetical protein
MLTHIVCFKYKAEVDEAARASHRAALKGLAGIGGLIDLSVGADIVGSPRSYDTGLIVRFRDRAALDAYQKHPQHVPVAQHGVSLCEHVVAVDFEE